MTELAHLPSHPLLHPAGHPAGRRARGPVDPKAATARLCLGVAAALAGVPLHQLAGPAAGQVLWTLALFLLPVPLLPAVMLVTLRGRLPGLGDLFFSDLVAIVYLIRVIVTGRFADVRPTASHAALVAFFGWATMVTATQGGHVWPLVHIMLYAAVGAALTHSPTARDGLLWTVLGLAVFETAVHLPDLTSRLYGIFTADPAQVGALLLAALLLGPLPALSRLPRTLVRALLLTGVVATQTRSIWFALGIALLAAALPRRWYAPVALPLALAPAGLLLVPHVTASLDLNQESGALRWEGISAGVARFLERPLTGHGWAADDVIVYNLWVQLGVAAGVVGVALFLAYVLLLGAEVARTPAAYLFLTAILAMSLTEVPLYGASVVTMLFFTLVTAAGGEAPRPAAGRTCPPGRPSSPAAPRPAPAPTAPHAATGPAAAAPARPRTAPDRPR